MKLSTALRLEVAGMLCLVAGALMLAASVASLFEFGRWSDVLSWSMLIAVPTFLIGLALILVADRTLKADRRRREAERLRHEQERARTRADHYLRDCYDHGPEPRPPWRS